MNQNQEVELKFNLTEHNFKRLKKILEESAKFVSKSRQIDEYFTPAHRNFVEPKYPFEWLRIGQRGDKIILNYKHWHPENMETATHCDELETEVKDAGQLNRILSALDFKKLICIDKERETYTWYDEFEIVLDKVKNLGFFVEIEALKDFGGIEITRKKLFELAKKLDLDTENPDKRGYPYLLLEKTGLIKK